MAPDAESRKGGQPWLYMVMPLFLNHASDAFWHRPNHQSCIQERLQKWNNKVEETSSKA
jgi:hypothetical protein